MPTVTVAFAASPRAVVSKLGTMGALRSFGGLTLADGLTRFSAVKVLKRARAAKLAAAIIRSVS